MSRSGRFWPFANTRTKTVSGAKLPLPPKAVKSDNVAVHTLFVAVHCTFATQVLRTGTESVVGQSRRFGLRLPMLVVPLIADAKGTRAS